MTISEVKKNRRTKKVTADRTGYILHILYYNIRTYRKIGLVHEKVCRFKQYHPLPTPPPSFPSFVTHPNQH